MPTTIETLSQQILTLTARCNTLFSEVHQQAEYVRTAAASAVGVTQSHIRKVSKPVASIAGSQTTEIVLTTVVDEFSTSMATIYGIVVDSPSLNAYQVNFQTKSSAGVYSSGYLLDSTVGSFKYAQPFSLIKNAPTDTMVVKITNLAGTALTGMTLHIYEMDIDSDHIGVMKRPILETNQIITALQPTTPLEFDIRIPDMQFSDPVDVVFGLRTKVVGTQNYTIEIVTRDETDPMNPVEKQAYITSTLTGDFKDAIPFSIIKENATDRVILRVANQSPTVLASLDISLFSVGVA